MREKEALEIHGGFEETKLDGLKSDLYKAAARYGEIRVAWWFADAAARREMERSRSIAHDVFIQACDILSRNQRKVKESNQWRQRLGHDRKRIGDFACHLHAMIGLWAR